MPRAKKAKTVSGAPNYAKLEAEGRNPGFNPTPPNTVKVKGNEITRGYVREPGSKWRVGYSLEKHLQRIEEGKEVVTLHPDEQKEFDAHMKKDNKKES
jgi:hypothetical protein